MFGSLMYATLGSVLVRCDAAGSLIVDVDEVDEDEDKCES